MSEYKLYRQKDSSYHGPGWGEPAGTFPSLREAMAAAGHPDPAHWYTTVGIPAAIFVDWAQYYDKSRKYKGTEHLYLPWTVEAPGVAAEYTDLLTADIRPGA